MDIRERFYNNLNMIREDYDENASMNEARSSYQEYEDRMRRDTSKRKSEWSKKIGRQQREAERKLTPAARAARDAAAERKIDEEQLNELRGKGTLSDKDKKELQGRIYKKHGKAWDDTQEKRKALRSKGSADTKDLDQFRNRLGAMYTKLDK